MRNAAKESIYYIVVIFTMVVCLFNIDRCTSKEIKEGVSAPVVHTDVPKGSCPETVQIDKYTLKAICILPETARFQINRDSELIEVTVMSCSGEDNYVLLGPVSFTETSSVKANFRNIQRELGEKYDW